MISSWAFQNGKSYQVNVIIYFICRLSFLMDYSCEHLPYCFHSFREPDILRAVSYRLLALWMHDFTKQYSIFSITIEFTYSSLCTWKREASFSPMNTAIIWRIFDENALFWIEPIARLHLSLGSRNLVMDTLHPSGDSWIVPWGITRNVHIFFRKIHNCEEKILAFCGRLAVAGRIFGVFCYAERYREYEIVDVSHWLFRWRDTFFKRTGDTFYDSNKYTRNWIVEFWLRVCRIK